MHLLARLPACLPPSRPHPLQYSFELHFGFSGIFAAESLRLCFDTEDQAQEWHSQLAAAIRRLERQGSGGACLALCTMLCRAVVDALSSAAGMWHWGLVTDAQAQQKAGYAAHPLRSLPAPGPPVPPARPPAFSASRDLFHGRTGRSCSQCSSRRRRRWRHGCPRWLQRQHCRSRRCCWQPAGGGGQGAAGLAVRAARQRGGCVCRG